MPYYEKRIYSGPLLEVKRYFATERGGRVQRREREHETTDRQKKLNEVSAYQRLYRLINVNFVEGQDLFVTLTHSERVDEATARREIKNYIERVRHFRRKNGLPEMKYIVTTEKQGQWHHHLVMNAMPMEKVFELWGKGSRRTISQLDRSQQYKDLARYFVSEDKPSKADPDIDNAKEPRRKSSRRWSCSRNLEKPTETPPKEIKRESILRREPTAPKGYRILPEWSIGTDAWGNLYQSFACIALEGKQSQKKRRKGKSDEQATKRDHSGKANKKAGHSGGNDPKGRCGQ